MKKVLGRAAIALGILLAGCATMPGQSGSATSGAPSQLSGYTCCNLHYENDWISDANWSSMPMIPAGASIKVIDYGRYRVNVEIDGRKMRLGLDYGRQMPLEQWAAKVVVADDPRRKIAAWPAPVRDAVRAGKVAVGMSKEQVLVAIGYPPMHQTPSLEAPQWKYWHTGFGSYLVVWDGAGRLKDVIADPQTRFGVLHEPGK
ncbi:MAG: hypothetical protein OEZ09_01140 [Betaproteobacteria bacterium]|nr:hypothetical protein [Betaproteobacteria bacterium]